MSDDVAHLEPNDDAPLRRLLAETKPFANAPEWATAELNTTFNYAEFFCSKCMTRLSFDMAKEPEDEGFVLPCPKCADDA